MATKYPAKLTNESDVETFAGTVEFTDPAVQPGGGLGFEGWTDDGANPDNVNTHGGEIQVANGIVRALSGTKSLEATADHVEVLDSVGPTALTMSIINGYLSQMAAGTPCYSATGAAGATVAFDAGGLLVKNVAPIQIAAAPPVGAPAGLPFAFDSTAVTGGLYVWDGAAWVKVSTIP